jgi:4a-hydroxytetrahydrobiopterin dehydratase
MTRVGLIAQEQQHHPDMAISWNKVTITITTHDAGSTVTDKDRKLAAAIEAIGVA